MDLRILSAAILIAFVAGCKSNLSVSKVTLDRRRCGTDHEIEGYRYYLSRPYVVVKRAILVCEEYRLVQRPEHVNDKMGVVRREVSPGASEVSLAEVQQMREVASLQHEALQAATLPGPAFDTLPSGAGEHLGIPGPEPEAVEATAPLSGSIEIVFLPDLEEQYAIRDVNCLGKNAYSLNFQDGWMLTDVSAEHDSTAVAIELLNTIDSAVNAAKSIATAGIDREARILEQAGAIPFAPSAADLLNGVPTYNHIVRTYIKPGIYRINKPWEIQGDGTAEGCGFLQKLGLTLVTEEQVQNAVSITLK